MFEDLTERHHMSTFLKLDCGPMNRIPLDGIDNLYLGNIPNALALEQERPKGFWAILNCTDDPACDHMKTDAEFDVMRLNQWDGVPYPGLSIKVGIEFIKTHLAAGANVLVCCHAGVSRSAGMVVAYLMYRYLEPIPRERVTLENLRAAYDYAVQKTRNSRPIIQIHPQIDKSIRQYYRLAPKSAEDLIA